MKEAKNRAGWSRGDKVLMTAIAAVIVLVIAVVLLFRSLDVMPVVSVPTPLLPSPNAFDYFVAAGNGIVDRSKVLYSINTYHPSSNIDPHDHDYTQAEKEALIAENAAVLKTFQQGLALPYENPPVRSFAATFPYYAKFRALARLTTLESQVRAGRGDWGGAVQSNLDAVQMGAMMPRGGVMIVSLVGIACQAIGRQPVWKSLDKLTAAQSKAAAQRLERIRAQHVSFADTLQQEEWMVESGLMEIFRLPNWRDAMVKDLYPTSTENLAPPTLPLRLRFTSKRAILSNYTHYMDQAIQRARLPYAIANTLPALTIPADPFNQILLPVFNGARFKDVQTEAQNALLETTLALRAYRLDHGAYPTSLSQLTPTYLNAIPADPFAASGPLHYKSMGTRYTLYSVGPDGKDNGGKPIFDASKPAPPRPGTSDPRYWAQADSKGDIVAGVNKL